MLTVDALITNPLDWHHFYEKISTIKQGDRTDFTVVTQEGDRIVGIGDIVEVEKWSNYGQYGFKVKIDIKRQKSLTDRRIRGNGRVKVSELTEKVPEDELSAMGQLVPEQTAPVITSKDMMAFREMLKGSVALDMTS